MKYKKNKLTPGDTSDVPKKGKKGRPSIAGQYHASKGMKGSIINKALGGRFG